MLPVAKYINSIGLVFDIVGALIIWKFGLPNRIPQDSFLLLESSKPADEREKIKKRMHRLAGWGIAFLILGFTLQLISNFV